MAFSTDYYDLYRKILTTDNYLDFLSINDQIEFATKLTEAERTTLQDKYTEILTDKFLYPDCKSIEEIKVPYKDGDFTRYSQEAAERKCIFAKDLGMTLADYLLRIENNRDFTIHVNPMSTTGNAQEVIRRMNRKASALNREEGLQDIYRDEAVKEMELGIDTAEINQRKIDELTEAVNELKDLVKRLQNDLQATARINAQKPAVNISPVRKPKPELKPINEQEGKPKVFGLPKRTAEKPAPAPIPLPTTPDYSDLLVDVPEPMKYYIVLLSIFIHKDKSLLQKDIILPNIKDHRITGEELQYIYDNRLNYGFSEEMLKLNSNNPIQVAVYCKYILGTQVTDQNRKKCTDAFHDFVEGWNYGK